MRRLPVYVLIDTSGSMKGEPIQSVNVGLQTFISSLRSDPYALETVYVAVYSYDKEVNIVLPLTEITEVYLPEIRTPESGPTFMGKALEVLMEQVKKEVRLNTESSKGDWRPILFLITDGKPSDLQLYRQMITEVKTFKFSTIIGCAAGPYANSEYLKELTKDVVSLENMDEGTFQQFFKWVSASISASSQSVGVQDSFQLPPPPREINLVF